jgi:hypothetical protein
VRRIPPRRAVLLAATLVLSTIAPGVGTAALAYEPRTPVTGSVRDPLGNAIEGSVFLLNHLDGTPEAESSNGASGFSFYVEPDQYTLRFESKPPGLTFDAPMDVTGDTPIDLTVPDAAPADITVIGPDDQPVTGSTLLYSAEAEGVVLALGIPATVISSGTLSDVGGHFSPKLFGPSTLTFNLANGFSSDGIIIGPGEQVTVQLPDTPSAPQNVTATAGDGKVKVSWDPPAYDGGSPITGYTVTASRNTSNFKASFGPSATSGTIRSLINGKTYSVTVVAKNANGTGAASVAVSVTLDAADPPTTTTTAPPAGGGDGDPLGGAGSGDDSDGPGTTAGSGRSGYWLLGADGTVHPFGDAAPYGDPSAQLAAAAAGPAGGPVRAVDLEPTPSGRGYWVLDSRGRIHPFGDAAHLGDVAAGRLSAGGEAGPH